MRCAWAESSDEMRQYHDNEWGVPVYNDQKLFEFLILEGAQAGLSWSTILAKRDGYRELFYDFNINKLVAMKDKELEEILLDSRIIRNRLKVFGVRKNAIAAQKAIDEYGSLQKYLSSFSEGKVQQNKFTDLSQIPVSTQVSEQMSKALKKYGFTFVGSTICYAFMQAIGMVNDHEISCFRHKELVSEKE